MAYSGKLVEVGPDGVGYIDCDVLIHLHSFRVIDLVNFHQVPANLNDLDGKWVAFALKGQRAVQIRLVEVNHQTAGA